MLWEILKASKGILVADFYADLWADIAGGGTPVDVFVEMIGSLPLYYNGKGYDLTDYLISGNTVQDGTPTPESPVPVVGCGTDTAGEWTLPVTVNSTEYPIYLGTVPTTRRVKKLVLTGEEIGVNKRTSPENSYSISIDRNGWPATMAGYGISSHFVRNGTVANLINGEFYVGTTALSFRLDNCTDATAFRAFLAAQSAAGTPVTVWYVLAEPETGIVNKPLMKIGDYADTINFDQAGVNIPVIKGNNVLTINTDVPPSETYIKYNGKEKEYGYYITSDGFIYTTSDGYKYGIRS